jgi:tetrahydromethanopterin S-methyltransferase subunit G
MNNNKGDRFTEQTKVMVTEQEYTKMKQRVKDFEDGKIIITMGEYFRLLQKIENK